MNMKTKLLATTLLSTLMFSAAYAAEHEVKMLNNGKDGLMVFEPGSLKVAVGDTVKFVPTDAGHDAVSHLSPEGGATWKGEVGKDVTVTIDKEGIYIYKCNPHLVLGMVGVIQAGEAKNKDAAVKSAKELSSTMSMGKDRLDKYLAALESSAPADKKAEAKVEEKKETTKVD